MYKKMLLSLLMIMLISSHSFSFAPRDGADYSVDLTGTDIPISDNPEVQTMIRNSSNWKDFVKENGDWRVTFDEISQVPENAFGHPISLEGVGFVNANNIEDVSLIYAEYLADVIGTSVDDLKLGKANLLGSKWFVTLDQYYHDVPVYDRRLRLRITDDGNLFFFGTSTIPDLSVNAAPSLTEAEALSIGVSGIGYVEGRDSYENKGLWILPIIQADKYVGKLCFRFLVNVEEPRGRHEIFVDAHSGRTLLRYDTIRYVDITGTVSGMIQHDTPFDEWVEEPFKDLRVTANGADDAITDENGDFIIPWGGTEPVDLEAELKGPFSRVLNQAGADARIDEEVTPGDNVILVWDDDNSHPAERDGFYHHVISHSEIKIIDPGLTSLDYDMYCRVNINDACNAYYDYNGINFYIAAGGCSNTAQIADVVYHEYGHAVTHRTYEPYSPNGAQHEGWSDYYAATITDQPLIGRGFYSNNPNSFLRNCDNDNRYPEDWIGQSHHDGMIMSGALWHLRQDLNDRVLVDSLFHYARYGYSTNYEDYFYDVLVVDDDDGNLENGTPHAAEIYYNFGNRHGIGPGVYVEITHTPLLDTEDTESPIPVEAEFFGIFDLNPDSILCFYDNGSGFAPLTMTHTEADTYYAEIPAQNSGTTVNYYLLGVDEIGVRGLAPESAPDETFSFYVGPDVIPPAFELVSAPDETIDLFGPYGPFVITATDVNNIDPNSVYIHYKINEGSEQEPVLMLQSGNPDEYLADIDTGQQLEMGDVISFYFTAADMANDPNDGRFPEDGYFTLTMTREELVDDFENGTDKWDLGTGWVLDETQHYQGDFSITDSEDNYGNNENNPLTLLDGYNMTPFEHGSISFMYKAVLLEGDYCAVEVTNDGGNTFTELGRITGVNNWQQRQYSLDEFIGVGNENVQLVFRMVTDEEGTSFGVFIDNIRISTFPVADLDDEADVNTPKRFALDQNYPNPFNPATTISYGLDRQDKVSLEIYNILGQKVRTFDEGIKSVGSHLIFWDGSDENGKAAASGVYFYRLQAGERTATKRMLLLK